MLEIRSAGTVMTMRASIARTKCDLKEMRCTCQLDLTSLEVQSRKVICLFIVKNQYTLLCNVLIPYHTRCDNDTAV